MPNPVPHDLALTPGDIPLDPADPSAYLLAVKAETERQARQAIDWYLARKTHVAFFSRGLRLLAVWLTVIGTVMPLAAGYYAPAHGNLIHLGYIALALAAGCVGFDKFFGFSSNWMRFMGAALALQRDLAEFQMDWADEWLALAGQTPTPEQQHKLLLRLRRFRLRVIDRMEQETQIWITEFQHNLAQLEIQARGQLEARKPLAGEGEGAAEEKERK